VEQVFQETVSGAKRERVQFKKLLDRLEPEDVLLVT
jgi:DNA invertase Pin-like site-specific DNA recombinase